jgi:hypothetical protein
MCTVGLLWIMALALSVVGLDVWDGRVASWEELLPVFGVVWVAPLILAMPLLMAGGWLFYHLSIEGSSVALAVATIWAITTAGYWGLLAWLSCRAVSRRSPRALWVLGGSLALTAPFWLIATAWMVSI